jgi:hypothetical protein
MFASVITSTQYKVGPTTLLSGAYLSGNQFLLAPLGVLAPGSVHARPSAHPPIDTRGIFLV